MVGQAKVVLKNDDRGAEDTELRDSTDVKGWGLGTSPQSIRGLGNRRRLSQRGPGRSSGNLRIFYVSTSNIVLTI